MTRSSPLDLSPLLSPLYQYVPLIIGAIVFVGLLRLLPFLLKNGRPQASARLLRKLQPKPLLTETEIRFFSLLKTALPEFSIFPQVAFQAVLKPQPGLRGQDFWALIRALGAKHADFLVCNGRDLRIVAFVELDDLSHNNPKRQRKDQFRDEMVSHAGYDTIRFHTRDWPKREAIRTAFGLSA